MYKVEFSIISDSYGFGFCAKTLSKNEKVQAVTYKDIALSKAEIKNFIDMLVRNEVDFVHIEEIVEDYFFTL